MSKTFYGFIASLSVVFLFAIFIAPAQASLFSYFQSHHLPFLPCNEGRKIFAAQRGVIHYDCSTEKNKELEAILSQDQGQLGFTVVTGYQKTLRSTMTQTQTNIPVSSLKLPDNTLITTALIAPKVYLDIEPGSAKEEIVVCTTVSATDFTNCSRGLAFSGRSEVASSTLAFTHNASSVVVISNVHYVYQNLVDIDTEKQFVTGTKWFTSNGLVFGDGTQNTNKFLYFCQANATSSCGFIEAVPSSTSPGKVDFYLSTDGASTQLISTGAGTGLSGGKGILVQNSVINFNPAATSTGALGFYGVSPIIVTSTGGGLQVLSDGLALNTSTQITWGVKQTFGSYVSTTGADASFAQNVDVSGTTTLATSTVTQMNATYISSTKDITINGLDANILATNSTTDAVNYHYISAQCASGQVNISGSGNTTIFHDLGVAPSYVTMWAVSVCTASNLCNSDGIYTASSSRALGNTQHSTSQAITGTTVTSNQNASNILEHKDSSNVSKNVGNLTASSTNYMTLNMTTFNAGINLEWMACK